jgi:hypothetical protein
MTQDIVIIALHPGVKLVRPQNGTIHHHTDVQSVLTLMPFLLMESALVQKGKYSKRMDFVWFALMTRL